MTEQCFWMIYGLNQRQPTVRHKTLFGAQAEAERLARVAPGVKFFILQAVEVVEKVDVRRTRLHPDHDPYDPDFSEIPF